MSGTIIKAAIAAVTSGIVYVCYGTYYIQTAAVDVKSTVHLIFEEGTIVKPSTSIDLFYLRRATSLSGCRIDVSNVVYTNTCITLQGSDEIGMSKVPDGCSIENIHFVQGLGTYTGTAILFTSTGAVDPHGHYIVGVRVRNIHFHYFEYGIRFYRSGDYDCNYVNSNLLENLKYYGTKKAIYFESGGTNGQDLDANIVRNVHFQPVTTHSLPIIKILGRYNTFTDIKIWDWERIAGGGIAFEFATNSNKNNAELFLNPDYYANNGYKGSHPDHIDSDDRMANYVIFTSSVAFDELDVKKLASLPFDTLITSSGISNVNYTVKDTGGYAAPDGTYNAWQLKDTTYSPAAGHYYWYYLDGSALPAGTYQFEFYAKKNTITEISARLHTTFTGNHPVFDLNAGTVTQGDTGTGIGTIQYVGNGWYKCCVENTVSANAQARIYLRQGGTITYIGNGYGAYLYGESVSPVLPYDKNYDAIVFQQGGYTYALDAYGKSLSTPVATSAHTDNIPIQAAIDYVNGRSTYAGGTVFVKYAASYYITTQVIVKDRVSLIIDNFTRFFPASSSTNMFYMKSSSKLQGLMFNGGDTYSGDCITLDAIEGLGANGIDEGGVTLRDLWLYTNILTSGCAIKFNLQGTTSAHYITGCVLENIHINKFLYGIRIYRNQAYGGDVNWCNGNTFKALHFYGTPRAFYQESADGTTTGAMDGNRIFGIDYQPRNLDPLPAIPAFHIQGDYNHFYNVMIWDWDYDGYPDRPKAFEFAAGSNRNFVDLNAGEYGRYSNLGASTNRASHELKNRSDSFFSPGAKDLFQSREKASTAYVTVTMAKETEAPDGTYEVWQIMDTTDNQYHCTMRSYAGSPIGTYKFTFFAKGNGWTRCQARMYNYPTGNTAVSDCNFNLTAGTVTTGSGTATITYSNGGWWECTITATTASATGIRCSIYLMNDSSQTTFIGDGTKGIFVWGERVEMVPYPPKEGVASVTLTSGVGSLTHGLGYTPTWAICNFSVANYFVTPTSFGSTTIGIKVISDSSTTPANGAYNVYYRCGV